MSVLNKIKTWGRDAGGDAASTFRDDAARGAQPGAVRSEAAGGPRQPDGDTSTIGESSFSELADAPAIAVVDRADALVALDEALDRLRAVEERLARVVECRYFAGLTEAETAEALGVSQRTVARDWTMARGCPTRLWGERISDRERAGPVAPPRRGIGRRRRPRPRPTRDRRHARSLARRAASWGDPRRRRARGGWWR